MSRFVDYFLGGIGQGLIIALMALALVLIYRSTRVVNFALVGQAMFTTYVGLTIQDVTGSWFLALLIAMVSGGLLGIVIQWLVLSPMKRADTSGAIIATFGALIGLQALAAMIWGGDPRNYPQPFPDVGFTVGGTTYQFTWYSVVVVVSAVLLVAVLGFIFAKTSLGLAMRASAFNPEVARLSGIRVSRMLTIGWVMAGVVGSFAGVLIAPFTTISPNSFDLLLVFAFTAAVIGGLDSLVGAVGAGVGTGLVLSLVTGYTDSSNAPLVALLLLVVNLIAKPEGIFSHSHARSV